MTGSDSILVADCGSTRTTAALIERVHGHHRLVARGEAISTHRMPWQDATIGVREAIRQIEATTGRRLLNPAGMLTTPRLHAGEGVDAFAAVSSAGSPLRVVLAGLTGSLSLASARRAVAGTYALVAGTLAMDEGSARRDPNVCIKVLQQAHPDVVVIAGGTDGGARRPVVNLAQLVALYNQVLDQEERPITFFAGNAHVADEILSLFASSGELRVVDNVRPRPDMENLGPAQSELETVYRSRVLAQVPGFDTLDQWSGQPILPTTRSFGRLIHYLGDRYQLKVVGIDVGSASTSLAARAGDLFSLNTRSDLGIGLSTRMALSQIRLEQISRWLPFEITPSDLQNVLLSKSRYPTSVPQTRQDLLLECALAREIIRQAVAQAQPGWLPGGSNWLAHAPQWDLIVGVGRTLAQAPHPAYSVLMLLDAFEPVGVSQVALDHAGIASCLGALAEIHPLAAAEVVEHDAFLNLGTVVAPRGTTRRGEMALRVRVCYRDGRLVEEEVTYGSIRVIQLPPGERAALELRPGRRFDVGGGEPGLGVIAEAEGGILGIIIDARGRPLGLPADAAVRQRLLEEWMGSLGIGQEDERREVHTADG